MGGVQTVLCKMRLKNQAGADHAMIRLLKKCKRQSKILTEGLGHGEEDGEEKRQS